MHFPRRDAEAVSGFTLVELTIVLLIVSIALASAAPKYSKAIAHYEVEAAARRIMADLKLVGSYAQRSSTPQSLTVNVSAESYAAPAMPDPVHPAVMYAVSLAGGDYEVDIATADFSGTADTTFDIYGRPSKAGVITVQSGTSIRSVRLDWQGNVSLE